MASENHADKEFNSIPTFTGENYSLWSRKVSIYLQFKNLSHFLEFKREDVEAKAPEWYDEKQDAVKRRIRKEQERATAAVLMTLTDDLQARYIDKKLELADLWLQLKTEYANANVATAFALELKLRELKYKSIQMDWNKYISSFDQIAGELRAIGAPIEEKRLASILARSFLLLLKKFNT